MNRIHRYVIVVLCVAGLVSAATAGMAAKTFQPDTSLFPNPERGFHSRYEIIDDSSVNDYASAAKSIAGFNPDLLDRTFRRARQHGNTLVHSYIHLDKYKNGDLPPALLASLASGLEAVRAAGLKAVLRAAYAWDGWGDVPETRMLRHMEQLDAVIAAHAGVVNHIEAGYLGAWGEWHTGLYTQSSSREEADVRYRLIKKPAATLPDAIPIVIRYPIFLKEAIELKDAPADCGLPGGCALTRAEKDRLGFHDDCFLADPADMGTYDNNSWMGWFDVPVKKQWINDLSTSAGGNKMVGGETCGATGDNDAAGKNVMRDMAGMHWTEINEDYYQGNIDIWKKADLPAADADPAESAFQRIKRKLGYRLRLLEARFPETAAGGGPFPFSLRLRNDGFAAPIKPRPVFLVFQGNGKRFDVAVPGADPRLWKSGEDSLDVPGLALPAGMPAGTYKLALWLPDADSSLRARPEYSIRCANAGTWDKEAGYNVLSESVTLTAGPVSLRPAAPGGRGPNASPGFTVPDRAGILYDLNGHRVPRTRHRRE
jgi:hypothetical protein